MSPACGVAKLHKCHVKPITSNSVIDFENYKIRRVASKYVKLLAEYGIECASLWTMDEINNDNEKKLFNKYIKQEMRKYGFEDH